MNALKSDNVDIEHQEYTTNEDLVEITWQVKHTSNTLYNEIERIRNAFIKRKLGKDISIQKLVDLIYDINEDSEVFSDQEKSRYYLLIFGSIFKIQSAKNSVRNALFNSINSGQQTLFISGMNFSGLNMSGLMLENIIFKDCDFNGSDLKGLQVNSCDFGRCSFINTNLAEAYFKQSMFEGAVFESANLSSGRFLRSKFIGCDFSELVSSRGKNGLKINSSEMIACSFRDADLNNSDFRQTKMTGCDTMDAKKRNSKGLI